MKVILCSGNICNLSQKYFAFQWLFIDCLFCLINEPDSCQARDEFNLLQRFSVIPEALAINLTAARTFSITLHLYFMFLPAV